MRYYNLFFLISLFCNFFISCNRPNSNIIEYQLLWDDLDNMELSGYQTHLDRNDYTGKVNLLYGHLQGSLLFTDVEHHFAIQGPGFFKVIINDEIIGYTRNGNFGFTHDDAGNYILTPQKAKLADHNIFYDIKLADTIAIYIAIIEKNANNESIIVDSVQANNIEQFFEMNKLTGNSYIYVLDWLKTAEQLKIYDVPYNKLQHFNNGIYILEPDYTEKIYINQLGVVQTKCLETSNVPIIEVITRMYYIIHNNKKIKRFEFKSELLKSALNQHDNEIRYQFIQSITPFLHLDY